MEYFFEHYYGIFKAGDEDGDKKFDKEELKATSPGRHSHCTLPLPAIPYQSLGIYILILLSLLSFSAEMTVSPREPEIHRVDP
jgi:hypothetical protein